MDDRILGYLLDQIEQKDEVIKSMMRGHAEVWDRGFNAAVREDMLQAKDPTHPFTRKNPYAMSEES